MPRQNPASRASLLFARTPDRRLFSFRRFAADVRGARAATPARAVTDEFLHAFSGIHFARIDIPLAVQAHLMQPVEIAGHPPAMSEPAELLKIVAAEDVDRLVGVVADIEAALRLVGREVH